MQNFTYQNTVKIVFGRDTVKQIGTEAAAFGKKVLLVYGHGSVKKNGLYDRSLLYQRNNGLISSSSRPNMSPAEMTDIVQPVSTAQGAQPGSFGTP